MKKKLQILSFFVTLSFLSCGGADKNQDPLYSDLNKDFPDSEKLELKLVNKFDILDRGFYLIDGSTLWYFGRDESAIGYCYDLNSGAKLSTIATRGRATNELIDLEGYRMTGDSIQLYTSPNTIKTFAKKDIIDNIPMGERKFSVVTAPDSINVRRMVKLPNGSVLATIKNNNFSPSHQGYEINKNSIVIFNDNEAKGYETIKYDSFDVTNAENPNIDANSLIKSAYADGNLVVNDSGIAAISVGNQFMLHTFDIKNGNVVKEKRYTKMKREGTITMNDMTLNVVLMSSNEKYILCVAEGYFSEKEKETGKSKNAIFVFDWDLNPIKKFYFEDEKVSPYAISNDCKSVYFGELTDDGFVLSKADLNI